MSDMELIPDQLLSWGAPSLVILIMTGFGYWLVGKTFANQPNNRLYRQLAYVGLFVAALIVLVIALPLAAETKSQLLTLFSYALTAVIALSSTSFVSNAMAGLMLKAMGTFHTGDFIRVSEQFGRVTAKALLHTEIQSEDRDTIALPNLFVIANPVKVVDQTGTLISAELSIGFDTHRRQVREHLITAAENAGLTEAFVQIMEIGDYAVKYKIAGFLKDVSKIVSKRSELKAQLLDALHRGGIEVMTPSVMNQRALEPSRLVIPKQELSPELDNDNGKAERLMFDKAEIAARVEKFREQSVALSAEIKQLEEEDKEKNAAEITWRRHQVVALSELIEKFDQDDR